MPRTRNRISGVVSNDTPQREIDHPVLGKYLELIDENDKALVPELIVVEHAEKIASESKRTPTKEQE